MFSRQRKYLSSRFQAIALPTVCTFRLILIFIFGSRIDKSNLINFVAVAIVFAFNKRADSDWLRSELFFVSITVARSTNEILLPTPPCLCFVTLKIFSTAFLFRFFKERNSWNESL